MTSPKLHSKSLNDLRNLDQKRQKNVYATSPLPIRKTESTTIPNGSAKPTGTSTAPTGHSTTSKTRPPYPLPATTEHDGYHDYEEPIDSPTVKTQNEETDKPPPLPSTKPPLEPFIFGRYDEATGNIKSSFRFELPLDKSATASSATSFANATRTFDNGSLVNTTEFVHTNSLYLEGSFKGEKKVSFTTTTDDYEEITPGEEYKVTFPPENDPEPSTLILMTQPRADITPESTENMFKFMNGFTTDLEDDFKVNVVKYDYQRNYSLSEDDISTNELDVEEMGSNLASGYTSQAASIFFGVDMEPPQVKPRKINLKFTDDEEDC